VRSSEQKLPTALRVFQLWECDSVYSPKRNKSGAKKSLAAQFKLMFGMLIALLRPAPKTAPYLALAEFSEMAFSADSPEWRQSHERQGFDELRKQKRSF
jgi:hypothetical protein